MPEAPTVLDFMHRRAQERPDRTAFRFLHSDESVVEEVSYAELRQQALAIAHALSTGIPSGSRALLLFDTEPGFVVAFFGCLAAHVLAVPVDSPHGRRGWSGIGRIAGDCRPAVIITTRRLRRRWEEQLAQLSAEYGCRVLTIEDCVADGGAGPTAAAGSSVAFLQYTSGSTSNPKGVMVTHANIIANLRMLEETFSLDADTRMVGWLPLFHDMGLVGFVLLPIYLGCTSTILSPAAFLEKPARWLRAITKYGGTISSSPNSGYELCCTRIGPVDRDGIDLSSLKSALNGAEPVSAGTLRRFQESFADLGFEPTAFRPCYGMAETTLLISATDDGPPIRVLRANGAHPSLPTDDTLPVAEFRVESADVVSCGRPAAGTAIRIVNPATGVECADGATGEVWVHGDHVTTGYWNNPGATAEAFDARLSGDGDDRGYLRTGDLGFVQGGELFLVGRSKELIIIRGRNFAPRDIEAVVAAAHDAIRAGHVAAVEVVHDTERALGIVAEIERDHWRSLDSQAVVDAILDAVYAELGLAAAVVTLLRPGGLPKTTSGKLKRLECRQRLDDGVAGAVSGWSVLHEWRLPSSAVDPATAVIERPAIEGLDAADLTDVVLNWLRTRLAQALSCRPEDVADEEPFARCGLDSAVAVTLTGELADWLRLDLDPTVFWEHAHPLALAEHLAGRLAARAGASDPVEHV